MWEAVRIGDLGKVITGKTPSSTDPEHFGDEYPFITPTDMDGNRKVVTARKISEKGYHKFRNQMLPIDSVCFVCIGATIGKLCITSETSLTNQQINSVVVNRNQYDPFFVYYVLSTFKEKVASIAGGAATPIVNKTSFENVSFLSPALPAQRKIAAILSAYDDLIENNLRRIKILEEMAHNLYCEWFVKFRFPGYEKVKFVDSQLGMIPEGWELRPLANLINSHIGGGWGKEEEDSKHKVPGYVIRGTDIPKAKHCQTDTIPYRYHTVSNVRSRKLAVGDIVFEVSGGSKDQPLGRTLLITEPLLRSLNTDTICASFCKRIEPNYEEYGSELMYLSFVDGYTSGEIEEYQVQSTGISNFKWTDYIINTLRVIPPTPLRTSFRNLVSPFLTQLATIGTINTKLRRSRDFLLPKLISGEVDVSDLNIKVSEEVFE